MNTPGETIARVDKLVSRLCELPQDDPEYLDIIEELEITKRVFGDQAFQNVDPEQRKQK